MGLALCQSQLERLGGESDQSRRVLAKIYAGFTEGFETADLRAAKAVLDEWGG